MATWQKTIRDTLGDISQEYLQIDAVEEEMPVTDLLKKLARFVDDPEEASLAGFDLKTWRQEFVRVAGANRTGELSPVMDAISDSERLPQANPIMTVGAVSLVSLLVDCRVQAAVAPIGEAVPPLVEAVEAVDDEGRPYDPLADATVSAAEVARLTGTAARSLKQLDGMEFHYPDTSVKKVGKRVLEALSRCESGGLEQLSKRIDRSANGTWTQADLTAYRDEEKTGRPFEELLAALWGDFGYEETTVINDGGGDGGVDVVAASGDRNVGIEAKRYDESGKIRAGHVRNLAGTLPKYGFDEVYFVTSTSVEKTDQAATEASQVDELTVVDGEQLAELLTESSLRPPVHVN